MASDWRQFRASNVDMPTVVDPHRRLRLCLAAFAVLLLVVFGREVQLELSHGDGFRAAALRPIETRIVLPAARGRILARDGTPLAFDRTVAAVAVDYRWLEEPPNERWLAARARMTLPKSDRNNAKRLAAAKAEVLQERRQGARRLADACGLSLEQWNAQTRRIQAKVERIARSANRRRNAAPADAVRDESWGARLRRILFEEPPSPPVVVAEELERHVVVADLPPAAVTEIKDHPDRYPAAEIVTLSRRSYPEHSLASHVVGYLGRSDGAALVGRAGVERQYQAVLEGRPGWKVVQTDRGGRALHSYRGAEPVDGGDLRLTLDIRLQRTAEELLRGACQRAAMNGPPALGAQAGGAVAVMDLRTGELLAAASAPAFDPNVFADENGERVAALLNDRAAPLLNRVCQMAIPPGSTFKVVTAAALLESGVVAPDDRFTCQGYLHRPDRQRCDLFVREGIGHGEIALADALAQSCNVYFFHFAEAMGPRPLVRWAERFGFGRATGVDLPGEVAGQLPSPNDDTWRVGDTQSLAIGQGSLTATPLQVLCMIAAVANGGRRVAPRVVKGETGEPPAIPLASRTLSALREGLRRVVADAKGTAHATVFLESTAVAGKTGTAETGGDRPTHAWFVGYAPADRPKIAFVVAIEHAGDAAVAAGPVAKRLVVRMEQLGLL